VKCCHTITSTALTQLQPTTMTTTTTTLQLPAATIRQLLQYINYTMTTTSTMTITATTTTITTTTTTITTTTTSRPAGRWVVAVGPSSSYLSSASVLQLRSWEPAVSTASLRPEETCSFGQLLAADHPTSQPTVIYTHNQHCVPQKLHTFYFSDVTVRQHCI